MNIFALSLLPFQLAGGIGTNPHFLPERASAAADTVHYSVVGDNGHVIGRAWSWAVPDQEQQYFLEWSNHGRGPKLMTRVQFDPRRVAVALETTGHDWANAPVEERFVVENGHATWRSLSESGEAPYTIPAAYVPLSTAAQDLLAQALLRAPGKRLPLLPDGEAWLERQREVTLSANGQSRTVVQYTIHGLWSLTDQLWLDEDSTFFSNGFVVRAGWESVVPHLRELDAEAKAEASRNLARTLRRQPGTPLAIRGVTLFDPATKKLLPKSTVLIEGNRIRAVGRDGRVALPRGAEIIDASGKTLLPGLWDMHSHVQSMESALKYLAAGVTTVREMAADTAALRYINELSEEYEAFAPRLLLAGIIDGKAKTAIRTVHVDSEDEAREAVRRYVLAGLKQIKIYSSVKPELVPSIVDEAQRHHLRVIGHIPAFMTAESAVRLGYGEITHIYHFFLNFRGDTLDTRTHAVRLGDPARYAAELDLSADSVQRFIRLLRERNVAVDPTLALQEHLLTTRPDGYATIMAPVIDRLRVRERHRHRGSWMAAPEEQVQRYRDSFSRMKEAVKALYDAGVTLLPGTDHEEPGFTLLRELELYVEAGIPAADVLYFATLGAAKTMHQDSELGSIAPGKLADLILVDGNPLERMSDVRRVVLTIKDGAVYEPAELYKKLNIRPCCS